MKETLIPGRPGFFRGARVLDVDEVSSLVRFVGLGDNKLFGHTSFPEVQRII